MSPFRFTRLGNKVSVTTALEYIRPFGSYRKRSFYKIFMKTGHGHPARKGDGRAAGLLIRLRNGIVAGAAKSQHLACENFKNTVFGATLAIVIAGALG